MDWGKLDSSHSSEIEAITKTKKAIRHIWDFLKDYIDITFANTHGAEFISDNHWEKFVSAAIQTQLLALSREKLVSLPLGFHHDDVQNELSDYTKATTSCHLENMDVLTPLPESCDGSFKGVVAESMSEKKLHEVEIMANAVSGMVNRCDADLVVDVGSGKGYLSVELAGHHHLNVLGLDSSQGTTHGAQIRKERLSSKWPALVAKTDNTSRKVKASTDGEDNKNQIMHHYIPVTMYVTPDMNLSSILSQHAMSLCRHPSGTDRTKAVISGLHTCGSLAVSAMRLCVTDPMAVGLCLVGCCYQLMEEESSGEEGDIHFPLSQFGKSIGLCLGRNARNLASQSVHRMAESTQLQGEEFYYRALLDVIIQKLGIPHPERIVGIRGLNKKKLSFCDYAIKAFEKLGFPLHSLTPEFASDIEREYQAERFKMAAYFQLKLALAPAIESLILLDRLLFLLEQPNIQTAGLVRLFDPVTSPRCYAILASKKNTNTS